MDEKDGFRICICKGMTTIRVGYTYNPNNVLELLKTCDSVTVPSLSGDCKKEFISFIDKNVENTIVILRVNDLGLQLIQLLTALEKIKKSGQKFEIVDKLMFHELSNSAILDILYTLAVMDYVILKDKVSEGVRQSKSKGIQNGRPPISYEVAEKIRIMYQSKNYTIREIAEALGISIGTVHKYGTKSLLSLDTLLDENKN